MTPIERVLQQLRLKGGVATSGKGWSARCPAHEDTHASLSIGEGDDGKVLVCCHAGCTAESVATALGLSLRDLRPPSKKAEPRITLKGNGKPRSWRERAREFHDHAETGLIARNLGLPTVFFPRERLRWPLIALGYTEYASKDEDGNWVGAVTMPMVDGRGEPCGITKRLDKPIDGKNKYTMPGGNLGVFLGLDYRTRPGPVLLPEGGSDVVALAGCGLSVVGRPSNTSGGDVLIDLLRSLPADRPVVVLGENDQKPDGSHPGMEGVTTIGPALSAGLGRHVLAAFPPPEHKDWRDWVKEQIADSGESLSLEAIGETIRHHIEASSFIIEPGAMQSDAATSTPRFEFIDSSALDSGDFRPQWHVVGALVQRQPAVIAGPSKSLKTGVSIDLAISLASGTEFLGRFKANTCRVAVVSGESGAATLQETARRVCNARGLKLTHLGKSLQWCFDLPTFSDSDGMFEFGKRLTDLKADVCILDPLYLSLGAIDPRNMFEMGQALRAVAAQLLQAGCTPILIHHANSKLALGEPMQLADLAYSGLEQFARQWMLLNRRAAFDGTGTHRLWLGLGGSAGHGGLWGLDVVEGVVGSDFEGRTWETTIATVGEQQAAAAEHREAAKLEKSRRQLAQDRGRLLLALDAEIANGRQGATQTSLKTRTGFSTTRCKEIINGLLEAGDIEPIEFTRSTGNGARSAFSGFRRRAMERGEDLFER